MLLSVHELCAVAMHYRGVVPLWIVAISFIPPAQFRAPFVHALTLDFHVATAPFVHVVCIVGSSMTFHQLNSHVATPHFVHVSCALAM